MLKEKNDSIRQGGKIFLVFVPHRDVRLLMRKYSGELFKAGFYGAYHFPSVAPLAVLSQPLDGEELKKFARALREDAHIDRIETSRISAVQFPEGGDAGVLFGPRLEISIPPEIFDAFSKKITRFFTPTALGACLMSADEKAAAFPPPPEISFRAGALANMFWQPLRAARTAGYEWKIGKLCWLAAKRKG